MTGLITSPDFLECAASQTCKVDEDVSSSLVSSLAAGRVSAILHWLAGQNGFGKERREPRVRKTHMAARAWSNSSAGKFRTIDSIGK